MLPFTNAAQHRMHAFKSRRCTKYWYLPMNG